MGAVLSRIRKIFSNTSNNYTIVMVGLDSAGKTTILLRMSGKQTGQIITTIPTIGFNIEAFEVGKVKFTCWDLGGQNKIRSVWENYLKSADGIVYVVDISDTIRYEEAGYHLRKSLESVGNYSNIPVLILANKADKPNDPDLQSRKEEMLKELQVEHLNNPWECRDVCAVQNEYDSNPYVRLESAFEWMVESLESIHKAKS